MARCQQNPKKQRKEHAVQIKMKLICFRGTKQAGHEIPDRWVDISLLYQLLRSVYLNQTVKLGILCSQTIRNQAGFCSVHRIRRHVVAGIQ